MIYLKRSLFDTIIKYCEIIKEELNNPKPNRRRISRYKTLIAKLLERDVMMMSDSTIQALMDSIENKGNLASTLTDELHSWGIFVTDKPEVAEVLREYFLDISNENFINTAKRFINKEICDNVKCHDCPLNKRNLSEEFSRYYHTTCRSFGLSWSAVSIDRRLTKVMKEYLELVKK